MAPIAVPGCGLAPATDQAVLLQDPTGTIVVAVRSPPWFPWSHFPASRLPPIPRPAYPDANAPVDRPVLWGRTAQAMAKSRVASGPLGPERPEKALNGPETSARSVVSTPSTSRTPSPSACSMPSALQYPKLAMSSPPGPVPPRRIDRRWGPGSYYESLPVRGLRRRAARARSRHGLGAGARFRGQRHLRGPAPATQYT